MLRKINREIKKRIEEVQRCLKKRMKKKGKEPYRKAEERKGGGVGSFPTTEDPTAPITPARKEKIAKPTNPTQKEKGEFKGETRKSGRKRWENKHGEEREAEREHKVYEWDRLIGDRIDIRQEEDIRIGTWNIRKQATLGK